jgi:hypothetical protein
VQPRMTGSSLATAVLFMWIVVARFVSAENSPYPDCPRGTYREKPLSKECRLCAQGHYGETRGLTTRTCSGPCPLGRYGDEVGLKTSDECKLVSPAHCCAFQKLRLIAPFFRVWLPF